MPALTACRWETGVVEPRHLRLPAAMQTAYGPVGRARGCVARVRGPALLVTCCQANDLACDIQRPRASGPS